MALNNVDFRGFSVPLLSLRGFAALAVLIFHGMQIALVGQHIVGYGYYGSTGIPLDGSIEMLLSRYAVMLSNGEAFVNFFFVHSGFVLALSISRIPWSKDLLNNCQHLFAYFIKRFFRIYPMVFYGCMLPVLALIVINATGWVPQVHMARYEDIMMPSSLPAMSKIWANLGLLEFSLNPFLWSIRIELLGSLLLPLFYYYSRTAFRTMLGVLGALIIYKVLFFINPNYPLRWAFVLCMHFGVLMGLWPNILGKLRTLSARSGGFVVALAALGLVTARYVIPPIGHIFPNIDNSGHYDYIIWSYAECLFSIVIIYLTYYGAENWLHRLASHPFSEFLGDVSFSFYINSLFCLHVGLLVTTSILGASFSNGHGLLVNLLTTLIGGAVCCGLSGLTRKYVELPTQMLGRDLSNKFVEWCGLGRVKAVME